MKILVSLLTFLTLHTAQASEAEYIELVPSSRLTLQLSVGQARPSGYLTTASSAGAYALGVDLQTGSGLMSFEWTGFTVNHDRGEFPLERDRRVRVSTYSFIPQVRVLDGAQWNLFLGLGLSHVNLAQWDPDYVVTYGTFVFSGLLRYQMTSRWSAHLKTQWYNVQQSSNNQDTHFEVWNNFLGLGWTFF